MLPLGGIEFIIGVVQPPLAVTLKYTVAPLELVADVRMVFGQLMVMGEFEATVKVTEEVLLVGFGSEYPEGDPTDAVFVQIPTVEARAVMVIDDPKFEANPPGNVQSQVPGL